MENVTAKRLPSGIIYLKGLSRGVAFEAMLNQRQTGGAITYFYPKGPRMSSIGPATLGDLLEFIHTTTTQPVVLNSIEVCDKCNAEIIDNVCQCSRG